MRSFVTSRPSETVASSHFFSAGHEVARTYRKLRYRRSLWGDKWNFSKATAGGLHNGGSGNRSVCSQIEESLVRINKAAPCRTKARPIDTHISHRILPRTHPQTVEEGDDRVACSIPWLRLHILVSLSGCPIRMPKRPKKPVYFKGFFAAMLLEFAPVS